MKKDVEYEYGFFRGKSWFVFAQFLNVSYNNNNTSHSFPTHQYFLIPQLFKRYIYAPAKGIGTWMAFITTGSHLKHEDLSLHDAITNFHPGVTHVSAQPG